MPTRFERWIRSKVSHTTALTPKRFTPLAAQFARAAGAVFLAGDQESAGVCSFFVAHGDVVDRLGLIGLEVVGEAAPRCPAPSRFFRRMLAKVPRIITS